MATAAPPPLAGLSVLVVEDHQDTLDMFEAYLQYCGAQVVTVVRSAQEALACLDGRHLDAITTDVSLHPQRAADFVSKVREREEYRRTPIIAVSGWTGKDFCGLRKLWPVISVNSGRCR